MRLSDIQDKDVVDVKTGVKIGNIIDIKISLDGRITSLILEKKISRFFSSNEEIEITFDRIKRIGEDVILINDL